MQPSFNHCLIFWSSVVISHLDTDFTGILSTKLQWMPVIALATTGDDQVFQINPGLSDQVSFLVVVEYGYLESEIVWRLVYGKSKFLVPRECQQALVKIMWFDREET